LSPGTHALADALKDVDAPGRLRKVGPSLRHLDSKVDFNWLYDWIRRPADFRPTTRMPQFFGHFEHLDGENEEFSIHDAAGNERLVSDREFTERFEKIEVRALAEFLLANSQSYNYIDPPQGVTESPSAERGKWLFESRGCLACHSHKDFPGINSTQGPDLSRVAAKFNTGKGARWLYSWLRAPNGYHAQTVMPDLFLEPIVESDAAGNPTGRVSDPAADIASFLLSVPADWQPEFAPSRELSADEEQALAELTAIWLTPSFQSKRLAERYAREGIPAKLSATVKEDERELLEGVMTPANRTQQQLKYIARRSLSRYGCFGCHDIPGYETAKPIGTPLAGWGRKDPAQLAFENIATFLESHGLDGTGSAHGEHGGEPSHGHGLDPLEQPDTSVGFFLQSLLSHQRTGFLWKKLRMPRAFDYQTTRNKRYDERLRMPRFPFSDEEGEAVMTFVLGLTNEAPAERYIYKPNPRQEAIVQGRHVLDKYNCAGCHILDMQRWDIAFTPDWFEEPPTATDFPFLAPQVTEEQIRASLTPDDRGLLHAQLHGMPMLNETTGQPQFVDIDGVPIEPDDTESEPYYQFVLYEHAVVAGAPRRVGLENLQIAAKPDRSEPAWGTAFPGRGGDLAKYLYPRVIAEEKKLNPAAVATEAWGWLPPPLHHEGEKVQTDWLHDFLMDPTLLRPAVVLRMPNFHMSSEEASKLVDYFAAKSNAEFPYEYNERRRGGYLADLEAVHPGMLDDAMKIVTDGNYCVKCHSVGDYQVKGAVKTLGPNLDQVYHRLRPEYVRHWVANPQRILPYTGMPVNIPFDPAPPNFGGVNQQLFPGPSTAQLDGVVDLLMNYDEYARRKTSVKGLVREVAPPAAQPPAARPAASNAPVQERSYETGGL
jgi:cytochrome c551/c552